MQGLGLPTRLCELEAPANDFAVTALRGGPDWATIAEETTRMVLIGNNPRAASAADCEKILAQMQ